MTIESAVTTEPITGSDGSERQRTAPSVHIEEKAGFHMRQRSCMHLIPQGTGLCLELGAQDSAYKDEVEALGYDYVGVDIVYYESLAAVADAHCLPFRDDSFDVVLLPCVLEHFRDPRIAMCEVFRVLKPGGTVYGAVAFIEPFHKSYFHMSQWATIDVLHESGFQDLYLDAGVNGMFLLWTRITHYFGLGRLSAKLGLGKDFFGKCAVHITFPVKPVLWLCRQGLFIKNILLRRDLAAFRERFDSFVQGFAMSLAGHIIFRASKDAGSEL